MKATAEKLEPTQAAPDGQTASSLRAWSVVLLLSAIFAIGIVDRVVLSMMVGPIKTDLHLSDSAFGMVQGTAVAVFYVLFAFPIGWAADRYDRRWIIFMGVTLWSLASASCGLVESFSGLFIARCLVGAGEAVIGPAGYPMIASVMSRQRLPLAMTILYLGGTAGLGLGQIAGGLLLSFLSGTGGLDVWMIGSLAPWRAVFLLTGLPGILFAVLIFLAPAQRATLKNIKADRAGGGGGFYAFFRQHRRFYLSHNLGTGLQQASLTGALLWNSAFMARTYGWTPAQIGAVFGGVVLATSAAAVIGHSWFTGRLFSRGQKDAHLRWQLKMSALSVPLLALSYLWPSPVAACIGFGLVSLINGGTIVTGPMALQLATPTEFRGRASAIYVVLATLIGTAVGPSLIGFATDFILRDEQKVGIALAGCCILFSLGAVTAFAIGLPAARRVMAAAETRELADTKSLKA